MQPLSSSPPVIPRSGALVPKVAVDLRATGPERSEPSHSQKKRTVIPSLSRDQFRLPSSVVADALRATVPLHPRSQTYRPLKEFGNATAVRRTVGATPLPPPSASLFLFGPLQSSVRNSPHPPTP